VTAPATPTTDAPSGPRWTPGRVVIAILIALMVSMWAYVLYLALVPGRQPPPDRLADDTFATEAQAICVAAHDDVSQLPRAIDAESAEARADVVAQANVRFAEMVDDLEAITPEGEDGEIVSEWLADWRTYLRDRADHVAALRRDPDAQLIVTAKDREQITEYLDAFAADNKMITCATPIDL
jgi:hypothetical protein